MKKAKWYYLILAVAGFTALCLGKFVLSGEDVKQISGFCIGLGAAAFVLGIGNFIGGIVIAKTGTEETLRQKNIEVNDERNTRIREKVGAKINQIMVYTFNVIILLLAFMGADLWILFMMIALIMAQLVLAVALTQYYSKRM